MRIDPKPDPNLLFLSDAVPRSAECTGKRLSLYSARHTPAKNGLLSKAHAVWAKKRRRKLTERAARRKPPASPGTYAQRRKKDSLRGSGALPFCFRFFPSSCSVQQEVISYPSCFTPFTVAEPVIAAADKPLPGVVMSTVASSLISMEVFVLIPLPSA